MNMPRTTGRLNFKGDIRATVQPRTYDTEHGLMEAEAASYDEATDRTTLYLIEKVSPPVDSRESYRPTEDGIWG